MAELKQYIGKRSLLLISLNAILGTGIFFLPALGAMYAGPSSVVSWIIMSVVAVFVSMYFAELASMSNKSGGVYHTTKRAFGDFSAFLIGWISWMASNITIAMLIVGSIIYIFPQSDMFSKIIISISFILIFNAVSYRGIEASTKLVVFFGVMTLVSLLMLIVPGMFSINTGNFYPFFAGSPQMVFLAVYFIAETFFGWETITYLSDEVKNSRKILPFVLIVSTIIIGILSILVAFVSIGNLPWTAFAQHPAPLAMLAEKIYGSQFLPLLVLIIFIPLIGTAASWILSSPRLLYAMSKSGSLPGFFGSVHKKYKTPHNAVIFQALATIFITIVALGEFQLLLSLLVPLAMIMYSIIMLSVVKLRINEPGIKRYFNAPFPKIGPVIVVIFNIFMLYMWINEISNALSIFILGLILILIGIPLYIIIKLQTDEKFTEKFFDLISVFWDRLFPLWYRKKDAAAVISKLSLKKNHNVLDFGCGSGITTAALARHVSEGSVIAVDISEKQLGHAVKRLKKMNISNVILIKEKQLKLRKNAFDAMTAVGVMEYIEDPKRTMKKLVSCLKPGGKFSILSFGKSMGMPAPEHLRTESDIRSIFRGLPVTVKIKKEKKRMTEYWHIWGSKKR